MDAVDSGQLRFVARNFKFLQGLRQVPFGVGFLLLSIRINEPWSVWVVLIVAMLSLIGYWKIGDYYKHRFGRAEGRPLNATDHMLVAAVLMGLLDCARFLTKLDPYTLMMPLIAFNGPWSSLGRRWYYLAFVLAFLTLAFWQRNRSVDVTSLRCLLFGLYLIVTGILDHLLLVRSLPGLRQGCDD